MAEDTGYMSLKSDAIYFDAIHIDPWKFASNFETGINLTIEMINYVYKIDSSVIFEIGTEQSIFEMSHIQINNFIHTLFHRMI